ncbi:group II intron maturase-specific domain-containing protein [Suicoccus acidiformans]|nr:group II intron maturase-specific domain-containing protein [Suicoccus acidiformans]
MKNRYRKPILNFTPAVSPNSQKKFRNSIRELRLPSRSGTLLSMIAEEINPKVRGWLNYFKKYNPSQVKQSMNWLKRILVD